MAVVGAAYAMFALVTLVFCVAMVRPGAAMAVALLVFGLEQALSAGIGYFAEHSSVWNIASAVGFGVVLGVAMLSGKYRFRGGFRPVVVGSVLFIAYFIWAASWGGVHEPAELLANVTPYFIAQGIVVPLLLQSVDDAEAAYRWTVVLGIGILGYLIAAPDSLSLGSRLVFRMSGEAESVGNPMALADATALVFLVLVFTPSRLGRGSGWNYTRWVVIAGSLVATGLASRGELLSAVVAATVTLLIVPGLERFSWVRVALVLLIAGSALTLILNTFVAARYDTLQLEGDASQRYDMATRMLDLYFSRPQDWFSGLGTNYSQLVIGRYPHNQYIQALTEGGILGISLCLFMHGAALWLGVTQLRRAQSDPRCLFVMRCAFGIWLYYATVALKRGNVLDVYGIASAVMLERCALVVSEWLGTKERAVAEQQDDGVESTVVRPRGVEALGLGRTGTSSLS